MAFRLFERKYKLKSMYLTPLKKSSILSSNNQLASYAQYILISFNRTVKSIQGIMCEIERLL